MRTSRREDCRCAKTRGTSGRARMSLKEAAMSRRYCRKDRDNTDRDDLWDLQAGYGTYIQ